MKLNVFKKYSDSTKTWVSVKTTTLHDLGVADKITSNSHQHGATTYVDGSVDMRTVLIACLDKGVPYVIRGNAFQPTSPIRYYKRYMVK